MNWIIVALLNVAAASVAAWAETELPLTSYLGPPRNWECRSMSLDQSNAIGFMSYPHEDGTVEARVLYKSPGGSRTLRMRLMPEDAKALRAEINALLMKQRSAPLRFEARVDRQGACSIARATG